MEIDRKKIEDWAEEYSAQSEFPLLIAKMVYATLAPGDYSYIPWGSAVNIGGWDGLVYSERGAGFIPAGRSIIEFGTNASPKTKADKDYNTRVNSKGEEIDRSQTTFIFMTPHCWKGCEKWQEEKKKENIWKDVRVYDSRGISMLLSNMESVTFWLARRIGLCTDRGVTDAERYWREGTISREIELNPRFFVAGRTEQLAKLEETLSSDIPIVGVSASSKEEALEFILAAGMSFSGDNDKRFKSKALVVSDVDALRSLPTNQGLIIIPTFEEARPLYSMALDGNCVFIPLGADTDYKKETIELTCPDKHELVNALEECGLERARAERMVRDAACSITAIKKDLSFFVQRAEWLNNEDVTELFAVLLCGRLNENATGDKSILSELSGMPFDDYKRILEKWSRLPLSPVLRIGATWRLVSPLSLWTDLTPTLPLNWMEKLKEVCDKVFVCSDSDLEYSSQLREGLLHVLIIIALYGKRIKLNDNGQEYVDEIIKRFLESDTEQQWNHIHSSLSLIAEAAPEVFITYVRNSLNKTSHPIISLFDEKDGLLFPESHHTDLLWALEGLAWMPEHLKEVTELLFVLSDMDPGGRLGNRPFNSLLEIYNPWVPQTTVGLADRIAVLKSLLKNHYGRMWEFLLALLPKVGMVFTATHKLKWRKYDCSLTYDNPNTAPYQFTVAAIEMLKNIYDGSDAKMAKLLKHIETLPYQIRKELIEWIGDSIKCLSDGADETIKALRESLWYQGIRGRRDSTNFDKDELATIQKAYDDLLPKYVIKRYSWLFDEYFPHLPMPNDDTKDIEKSNQECKRQREEACRVWLSELGGEQTIELRKVICEPVTLGITLASIEDTKIYEGVISLLANQDDLAFVRSYLSSKEELVGEESIIELFKSFAKVNNDDEIVGFLCCLNQTLSLWEFIDTLPTGIQTAYWKRINVPFIGPDAQRALYAVERLCSVGRAITAMNGSWHYANIIPTNILQDVLFKALSSPIELNGTIDYLAAESYLEELHKRGDREDRKVEALEWYYLPLMRHHAKKANVELVVKRLNQDAAFFVELLTYLFVPDDGESETVSDNNKDEEAIRKANAERAYELFDQWKDIPGVDFEGKVDVEYLSSWLEKALAEAKKQKREKSAYIQLGKLFAQFPEQSPHWPPLELFSVLETIDSEIFFRNYEYSMFNKRGFTSRGPYEGGDIERNNSAYFKSLYAKCAVTCPKIAKVFGKLSKQYGDMAKEMDDQATIAKLDY